MRPDSTPALFRKIATLIGNLTKRPKTIPLSLLVLALSFSAEAQNVSGYGYTSYTSVNGGTWTYGSVSNPYTITYSGTVFGTKTITPYTPAAIPTGLTNYLQPASMLEVGGLVNSLPAAVALYSFTSTLPSGTVMFIQDIDARESFRIEFLDASGTLLSPASIGTYNLSNPARSAVTFNATNLTVTATDATNYAESLSDFVISSNLVKQVRISQIAGRDAAEGYGTAEFYFAAPPVGYVNTQTCMSPAVGCSSVDFTNSYLNSTTPNTLEYDNIVSTFHSTVARQSNGTVLVWGERMANNGSSHVLTPQILNSTNYPALTGEVLRFTGGSENGATTLGQQYVVLTTTGLFAWGVEDRLISTSITSSTTFQKITVNGKTDGLPLGVTPGDVKMLFGSHRMLALVTCDGSVYTLVNALSTTTATANAYGDGSAYSAANNTVWHRVKQDAATNISNVVAVRGGGIFAFTALKSDGTLWTWGYETYLGNGTAVSTTRNYATQMTLPAGVTPKMIGMKGSFVDDNLSYYLLSTSGFVYSLGSNLARQLGDFTTTNRTSWVRVLKSSTTTDYLSNIVWISPSEHDGEYMAPVNAIESDGSLWSWGENESSQIGQPNPPFTINPTKNTGGLGTSKILAVETGGHTTLVVKQCDQQYGYVGHRINGSMGDGTATSAVETVFNFTNTATISLCGASAAPTLTASSSNICSGAPVTLTATPTGGTYTVTSGNATVSGNIVTVTGPGQVNITYTAPSCDLTATISLSQVCPISITGNVYNDIDGLTDNTVDNNGGAQSASTLPSGLTANLFNATTGAFVATVTVQADGSYTFPDVTPNTNYTVIISNVSATLSNTATTFPSTLPTGWVSTGDVNPTDPTATTLTPGISSVIEVTTNSIGNVNFGIEQPPVAVNNSGTGSIGTATTLNILTNDNDPSGTSLHADSLSLILPVGATNPIYDAQGDLVGFVVPGEGTWSYNNTSGEVTFTPAPGYTGNPTPITYTVADLAGVSSNVATVTISYPSAMITGTVFVDANGTGTMNIGEPGTTAGTNLYVYLINSGGIVIDSAKVNPDGTYTLVGTPNTAYTIELSTIQYPIRTNTTSTPINNTPPAGWVTTGEGAANTNDLTPNGTLSITSGALNTTTGNNNFGIEQLPDSNPRTQFVPYPTGGVIPAGTVTTAVSGTDPEDGVLGNNNTIVITSLPTNATMLYNGVPVTVGQTITNFNPALLSFTGITNGSVQVVFQYAFVDAAGKQDPSPAPFTLTWANLSPLPIKLESFTIKASQCDKIELNWKVSDAVDFSHFEIERSVNGAGFSTAGLVMYATNSTTYQFSESNLAKANYQYRVKLVDKDGKVKYSTVVFTRLNCGQQQILVYPNPARDKVTINGMNGGEQILLYNGLGQVLQSRKAVAYQENLNISTLSTGMYYLTIVDKAGIKIYETKIVKSN